MVQYDTIVIIFVQYDTIVIIFVQYYSIVIYFLQYDTIVIIFVQYDTIVIIFVQYDTIVIYFVQYDTIGVFDLQGALNEFSNQRFHSKKEKNTQLKHFYKALLQKTALICFIKIIVLPFTRLVKTANSYTGCPKYCPLKKMLSFFKLLNLYCEL